MSGDTPGESAMARNAQTTANSDRERSRREAMHEEVPILR
jgi:hypothetical protein